MQLLTDGEPVVGRVVTAVSHDTSVKGETDVDGRVTLKIGRGGAWLIRTVHMVPLTESPEAEWESYWVTLSFHTADVFVPPGSSLAGNSRTPGNVALSSSLRR